MITRSNIYVNLLSVTLFLWSVKLPAEPPSPRELTLSEKSCRVWDTRHGYVSGPTMKAIGSPRPIDDFSAGAKAENCVISVLLGREALNSPDCSTSCIIKGVESELAGEPIRKYIEANLKQEVTNEVKRELANFLKQLKDLNDTERQAIIDRLVRDLPDNQNLVAALRDNIKQKNDKGAQ